MRIPMIDFVQAIKFNTIENMDYTRWCIKKYADIRHTRY
ncbi:hypothetical protein AO385_0935 [Moraxella catarrhalis]|uniref:Uncharacterized protein n=1 Tax=Moraxella catarrhalis TaxID=480 RepID=A0A198UJP7_MORCA|nr:hypothetical protein AO384_1391 [Moraxella catarrhalis]OAU99570.1 hypothetical protein AO383_0164 [Moraxella catarrhalis]OAV02574.1 hypothetical protein AO385_0935 [Moraxella catarrhalis]